MTGLGPVRMTARAAQRPAAASYHFELRAQTEATVALAPRHDLPTALAGFTRQLNDQLDQQNTFGRVSTLRQDDEAGHCFSFSISFSSIRFAGSPVQKVRQVIETAAAVLREIVPGLGIAAEATPVLSGQELTLTEADNPAARMDGIRATLRFGLHALR